MNSTLTCQRCGEPVSGALLEGLCPHCIAAATFDEPFAEHEHDRRRIGDYELMSELGRGGMGVVYLARQRSLDRLVALKTLVAGASGSGESAGAEERFLREAREAARLRHPHIVAIHEVGHDNGRPFYSMDLIEGDDLASYVTRRKLSARDAALLVAKIARAVQHAHESGVLHRDLKPGNVLVDAADEPHLTDFGLVTALDGASGLTRTGEIIGSPGYMAPEQLRGEASIASDVYALGAILYFLLTGRPPFVAAQLPELLAAIARGDPLSPRRLDPSIPRDLDTITTRAVAPEPAARYASAADLADDLTRWSEGRAIYARPVGPAGRLVRWARRNQALATIALALVVTAMGGVAGITSQWLRAERAARDTTRHLYSADLKVASDALLVGDLGLARATLSACPIELRDAAWGLLWPRAAGEAAAELGGGRWTVTHLAVSPDGRLAASTAQHDEIRLWDLVAARPLAELPAPNLSWWAAFNPDGRLLYTADAKVREWDAEKRVVVREFPGQSGALSPDGRVLYTCDGHRFVFESAPGPVAAWNLADGTRRFELPVQARTIALSRDGTRLAISDAATWIAIHDAASGEQLVAPWPSLDRLWHLEFTPDGRGVVASGWSKQVRVWSLPMTDPAVTGPGLPAEASNGSQSTGNPLAKASEANPGLSTPAAVLSPRVLEHPLTTWEIAFSPDGRQLAVACSDRQVYLWDAHTWQLARTLRGHHNEVWSLAWQPDGQLLSAGRDPRVLRWQTAHEPVKNWLRHDGDSFRIAWLPDARIASLRLHEGRAPSTVIASVRRPGDEVVLEAATPLAYDARTQRLWLWNERDELCARNVANWNDAIQVPWRREGAEEFLDYPYVVPGAGLGWAALRDGALVLHRLSDGQRVARFDHLDVRRPWAAALSPDGKRFVWGGQSTELFWLDLATGERRSLEGHYYDVAAITFAPDGQTFMTGGGDGLLFVWDAATGRRLSQLGAHATSVSVVGFSPDGGVLFSHEESVGIHVWHVATQREVAFLPLEDAGVDQWSAMAPDGRWLAARRNDGELRIFPIATADGKFP